MVMVSTSQRAQNPLRKSTSFLVFNRLWVGCHLIHFDPLAHFCVGEGEKYR